MKMNLPAVLMIFAGAVLIYANRKDQDPRNVIFEALGIKRRVPNPPPVGVGKVVGDWVQPSTAPTPPRPATGAPVSV